MAGRFPLYTDADIQGPVVKALRGSEWDVLRAIEAFKERTLDPVHFSRAAELERVLVLGCRKFVPTFLAGQIVAHLAVCAGCVALTKSRCACREPSGESLNA